ncbi:hypothetical protein [Prauserella muralis]|uniref:Uncharacterized protein n=1 Tax=Prauserella muralis TaxID=588067 RepID=A0A2V4B034_9PSEU|nr:hypothetical protein [Prauserella muralis]PXY27611.1 hypothetical protein BAY60_14495 [Prauserella muralis]TWE22657.1 hypothetical protein FHX69_3907 [Prauserella muralis]
MSNSTVALGRRAFLARLGLLGAVGAGGLLSRGALAAPAANAQTDALPGLVALLRPVLAELARDTLNGLSVFALPGPDPYSAAQGTPSDTPGAMEARTTDFLIEALDNFVPFPDQLARPAGAALATGLADTGIELPGTDLLPGELATLDKALAALLENDATLPLSFPISGLLNLLATQVNPLAVNGPFLSPFARLNYAEKARAFELLEGPDSDLVALLDVQFPEPLKASVSGLLKFVGGALIEFASFGSYTEYAVFDRGTRQLTGRPVGWQLTGYQPDGPVEGWDDFIGYYQGRTEVHD